MVSAVEVVEHPDVEELKLLDPLFGFVNVLGCFVEVKYNQVLLVQLKLYHFGSLQFLIEFLLGDKLILELHVQILFVLFLLFFLLEHPESD